METDPVYHDPVAFPHDHADDYDERTDDRAMDLCLYRCAYPASTNVYYLLWTYGFKNFNSGLSAAAAVVFFIGFGLLALLFTRLTRKIAFYDN